MSEVPPEGTLARAGYEYARLHRTIVEKVFAPICMPVLRWLDKMLNSWAGDCSD